MPRYAWAFCMTIVALAAAPSRAADEPTVVQARAALEKQYGEQLERLATWCDEHKLADEAKRTRGWLEPRDPRKLYVIVPNDAELLPPLPDTLPADSASKDVLEWRKRFSELRRTQSEELFKLAGPAIKAKLVSLAFELVIAAVRENPDHEKARRLMGYVRFNDAWHTPYEVQKLKRGFVWNDKFGWIASAHLARFEKGDRYTNGRWYTAEQDAEVFRDIRNGRKIETEHYLITTNLGLEDGVKLGIELERLYLSWQQAFPQYLSTPEQLAALYDGRTSPSNRGSTKFKVVYFRNREEYVAALQAIQPNIGLTTGIYFSDQHTAYFFAGGEHSQTTLYHEATHQLFHESRTVSPLVGRRFNFWVIEGIACYMESLRKGNGYYTLGGVDTIRFENAMARLIDKDFYVPLGELCQLGMDQLQRDPRIQALYSQASGLTHFLMHYEQGKYRDALMAYLVAIYIGRDNPLTLAEVTGVRYPELDKQYRDFITASAKLLIEQAKEKE